MTFDGISPTQQYLIDNAVFYGGRTYEEAYEEIVGTAPHTSIESIGTTYGGGPTQTNFPTNVYMDSEVVVNSGDERQPTIHAASPVDVTRPMTTVSPHTDEPKGPLDFFTPEGLMSFGLGFTDAGTPFTLFEAARGLTGEGKGNWLSDGIKYFAGQPNTWLGGLIGEPTGSGLFGESLDEGSYTAIDGGSANSDNGGYSYGTIDGIGVEEPN